MGENADGSELVNDKNFQNLLAKMDDDADEAEKQWKAQSTCSGFSDFPKDSLAQYKADGALMIKSRGSFNGEWNKVAVGKGDPKKLLSLYDGYSTSLGALSESNARFKALIDLDVAGKAAAWLTLFLGFAKFTLRKELEAELKGLQVELEEAEEEVTEAEVKMALNLVLSAVSLVLTPEGALAKVGLAAGSITGHIIIDNALGHGSAKGTVVFVAGDGPELIDKMSEGGKKLTGAVGALITAKFDYDEVSESKKIVDRLKPKFASALKAYQDFMAGVLPLGPKLRAAEASIKALNQQVNQAMTRSSDAAKNYDAIKAAIKKSL